MREVTFFTGGQLGLEVGRKVRDLEVQQTCSRCTGANENFKDLCYTEVLRVALTVSQEIVLHTTATVIICISVLYQHMHLLNPPTHVWVMVHWSKKKKDKRKSMNQINFCTWTSRLTEPPGKKEVCTYARTRMIYSSRYDMKSLVGSKSACKQQRSLSRTVAPSNKKLSVPYSHSQCRSLLILCFEFIHTFTSFTTYPPLGLPYPKANDWVNPGQVARKADMNPEPSSYRETVLTTTWLCCLL